MSSYMGVALILLIWCYHITHNTKNYYLWVSIDNYLHNLSFWCFGVFCFVIRL